MNFIRSRLSIGNFTGQRYSRVIETWSKRGMCNKPQEVKAEPPPPAAPAHGRRHTGSGVTVGVMELMTRACETELPSHYSFKIPGYRPSNMDKKILTWSGLFKTADQIPEFVSYEMINAARNKARVKVCYLMMAATVGACLVMVFLGKRAAGRNESLTNQNMEKKARWREELQREREATTALSEKTQ